MESKDLCIVDVNTINKDNVIKMLAMIHSDVTITAISLVDLKDHSLHKILSTLKYLRSKLQDYKVSVFCDIYYDKLSFDVPSPKDNPDKIPRPLDDQVKYIYHVCKELCYFTHSKKKIWYKIDDNVMSQTELSNFYHLLEYYYNAYLDTHNQSKIANLKELESQAEKYDELFKATNNRNVELDKQIQELKFKEQEVLEMQKIIKKLEDDVKQNNTYFKPHFYAKMRSKIWDVTYLEKTIISNYSERTEYTLDRISKIEQFLSKNPNFLIFLEKPYPDKKLCEFCNELYKKYNTVFDLFTDMESKNVLNLMMEDKVQLFVLYLEKSNLSVDVEGST